MSVIQVEEKKVEVGKVLCVGRNYVEHIHELDNAIPEQMVVFNKPSTSVSTILRSFHQ
ncbi:TPA: FAA hydrolase family protein, partial [Vibrio parahaemolyticus]|nr:FAA hydrolase family protein [Vibrio parahaemolyticus]